MAGTAAVRQAERADRRGFPRYAVSCTATVTVLAAGSTIEGQMVDLSRGGCRLATPERVAVGVLARVEVRFMLRGMAFRIVGVTAGTRTGKSFAVRFLEMPRRHADELAELLAEIEADPLGPVQPAPVEMAPPKPKAVRPAREAAAKASGRVEAVTVLPVKDAAEAGVQAEMPAVGPVQKPKERRAHNRHAVDTSVNLTLVRGATTMAGCILNLSQGGCRLRTDEHFRVGIYARVEAEFFLHGLPFRLAGVSQAIMDRNTIGVRFLDMSARKRGQLTELIAEIEEKLGLNAEGNLPAGEGA